MQRHTARERESEREIESARAHVRARERERASAYQDKGVREGNRTMLKHTAKERESERERESARAQERERERGGVEGQESERRETDHAEANGARAATGRSAALCACRTSNTDRGSAPAGTARGSARGSFPRGVMGARGL